MRTEPAVDAGRKHAVAVIVAVVLVSAALYFARIVLEPVAFTLFAMALVEPFREAAAARLGKGVALILTLLLTLLVFATLVWAIVWSVGDIIHWGLANVDKFQSLYMRTRQLPERHDLFVVDLSNLNSSSFVGMFRSSRVTSIIFSALLLSSFCF